MSGETIEHLVQRPEKQTKASPILLQHGAWHGAWCWSLWMDYFASLGYEVHAISLPGHGQSSMAKGGVNRYSLATYAEILGETAVNLPTTPIIIGHSMGGAILQKLLESYQPEAAVFLATLPNRGIFRFLLSLMRHYPIELLKTTLTLNTYHLVTPVSVARAHFFTPEATVDMEKWASQLTAESFQIVLNTLFPFAKPQPNACPALVLAGEKDAIFTVAEAQETADRYGAEHVIFANQGHNLMAEPAWQTVANTIDSWIQNDYTLPNAHNLKSSI